MLFVHFTPISNVKRIKRAGLVPGKGEAGVFLRPLIQGEKTLTNDWSQPSWWRKGTAKRQSRMAKIIVRLPPNAVVRCGDCGDSRGAPPITVRSLGQYLAQWRNPPNDRGTYSLQIPWRSAWVVLDKLPPGVIPTWSGFEVLYEGVIPPRWIVKILAEKDTDEKCRPYRRHRRQPSDDS